MPPHPPQPKRVLLLADVFFDQIQESILRYAFKHNWQLYDYSRVSTLPDPQTEFDGVLVYHGQNQEYIDYAQTRNCPVVAMGSAGKKLASFPRVEPSSRAVMQLALDHLRHQGFKRIGFVHLWDIAISRNRESELQDILASEEQDLEVFHLSELETLETHHPIGLVCFGDTVAIAAVRELQKRRIFIPEEVALVGIDNTLKGQLFSPSITSIDPGFAKIAHQAATMLDRLMAGDPPPTESLVVVAPKLFARETTDIISIDNRFVAAAMQYLMRAYRRSSFRVEELAGVAGCSLWKLQQEFKQHVGHTISAELSLLRLNYAKRQLEETDDKIFLIAERAGFAYHEYFTRLFRRETGMTPSAYRKTNRK